MQDTFWSVINSLQTCTRGVGLSYQCSIRTRVGAGRDNERQYLIRGNPSGSALILCALDDFRCFFFAFKQNLWYEYAVEGGIDYVVAYLEATYPCRHRLILPQAPAPVKVSASEDGHVLPFFAGPGILRYAVVFPRD